MKQIAVVGQPEGMMWAGSDLQFVLCMMLLIVFHIARGLDEEDLTTKA